MTIFNIKILNINDFLLKSAAFDGIPVQAPSTISIRENKETIRKFKSIVYWQERLTRGKLGVQAKLVTKLSMCLEAPEMRKQLKD